MANDRQNSRPSQRWSRLWNMAVSTLRDYVVDLRWKGEEEGITAVQGLMRRDSLYWPGLIVLAFAVVAAPYLSVQGQRFAAASTTFVDQSVRVPLPTLHLSFFVAALAWAYLLVGAIAAGMGPYVLVASYVAYFGLQLGQGWSRGRSGSFWFPCGCWRWAPGELQAIARAGGRSSSFCSAPLLLSTLS